jgi:translation initiation factor IF-2
MPQTEEAINHARAADVPIVVALNKIDKSNANPLRVKQQLATIGLTPEEWGGNTVVVDVSAVTGQGIDDLLDILSLEAELLELKANPDRPAQGTVLESELTEGRGIVANVLIQKGTLHVGDVILAGTGYGRVRAITDDKGRQIEEAGPSTPIEVLGLSAVPEAGDRLHVLDDIGKAKAISEDRERKKRAAEIAEVSHVTLETLFKRLEEEKVKELRVILKADVKGSIEVLKDSLLKLGTDEVKVKILHHGVGGINESDIMLADASDAIIVGFHVVPEEKARHMAEERGVDVQLYRVIYRATEDIKTALEGKLEPEEKEVNAGWLSVREVFRSSAVGNIAGCYVEKGKIERSSKIRLIRDNVVIHEGTVLSLRRFKDDVKEVKEGFECGLKVKDYEDIKVEDRVEAYEIIKIARKLD